MMLYLKDGTTEMLFGEKSQELKRIIREHLGTDCEELFEEIENEWVDPVDEDTGDNYERISDGYRNMLTDVMNELHEVLSQKKISRKRIEEIYNDLNANL